MQPSTKCEYDGQQYLKLVTLPWRLNLPNAKLLDVRTQEECDGKVVSGQKRSGHIPISTLIPFKNLYQDDGKFISAQKLTKLIGSCAGNHLVTYCIGGVRSALLALLIEARFQTQVQSYALG